MRAVPRPPIPIALLAATLSLSCGNDEDPFANSTDSTPASMDGCTPGDPGCSCEPGGICGPDLVCDDDVCVDPSVVGDDDDEGDDGGPKPDDGGDESGEDDGGEPGSCAGICGGSAPHLGDTCFCDPSCTLSDNCCPDYETECPGQCLFNDQCASDEVCSVATQECVAALGHTYDVTVAEWEDRTPDCWDAFDGDCLADVLYQVRYGGETVFSSDRVNETVFATWDEPVALTLDSDQALVVTFYDWDDITANDFLNTECFLDDADQCGPTPVEFLHAGGRIWDEDDFYVWLQLRPH